MRKWQSLTALRAFEAVARQGSITAAAQELHVTRPAISKQIALLERDMACQLFHRDGNRIDLTPAGAELQAGLQTAFDLISTTTDSVMRGAAKGERVRILVCRDFASNWLAEQVGTFLVGNPGISVEITAEKNARFRMEEDFDFRIFYGPDTGTAPPGLVRRELFRWIDMPVCSPDFAMRHLKPGQDLAQAPQLVDANYDVWEEWCAHAGLDPGPSQQRTLFSESALCMSAAAAGGGIAIGDTFLTMPFIRQGQLIVPFRAGLVSALTYALFTPQGPTRSKAARRFEQWLRATVSAYQDTMREVLAALDIRVMERRLQPLPPKA
nr:LysR substrate-binding domain-containing protein [uncultured Gellertiella sp.]